jgi:predicted DNA-binding protein with PD1-like motif
LSLALAEAVRYPGGMKKSDPLKVREVIVARCEPGDDLYQCLAQLVKERGVRAVHFQVIGAVSRAKVGIFEHGRYEWLEHAGVLEISSCLGNVAVKEGESFVHCHAVFTDDKGTVLAGHVSEGCIVEPTAEIHLTVYEGEVKRRQDPATRLWVLDIG